MKAITIEKDYFGENFIGLATSYNNLADIYSIVGRYKLAENYYKLAI